jgi:hypothetical protein
MRISSLRALLLALAMVLQTIAGGAGVARSAMSDAHPAVSAHCARLLKQLHGNEGRAPAGESDRGMCQSCLVCDEPPAAWVHDLDVSVAAQRASAPIAPPSSDAAVHFATIARAQSARGPPAA